MTLVSSEIRLLNIQDFVVCALDAKKKEGLNILAESGGYIVAT